MYMYRLLKITFLQSSNEKNSEFDARLKSRVLLTMSNRFLLYHCTACLPAREVYGIQKPTVELKNYSFTLKARK